MVGRHWCWQARIKGPKAGVESARQMVQSVDATESKERKGKRQARVIVCSNRQGRRLGQV